MGENSRDVWATGEQLFQRGWEKKIHRKKNLRGMKREDWISPDF